MADNYVTSAIADVWWSADVREELFSTDSGSYLSSHFLAMACAATAKVQSDLRSSGYTPPTRSTTDEYIKMATMGVLWEMAAGRPDKNLVLPQDWETSPLKLAADAIELGTAQLTIALDKGGAVGGIQTSEYSTSVTSFDGSRQQIFSRKRMSQF